MKYWRKLLRRKSGMQKKSRARSGKSTREEMTQFSETYVHTHRCAYTNVIELVCPMPRPRGPPGCPRVDAICRFMLSSMSVKLFGLCNTVVPDNDHSRNLQRVNSCRHCSNSFRARPRTCDRSPPARSPSRTAGRS